MNTPTGERSPGPLWRRWCWVVVVVLVIVIVAWPCRVCDWLHPNGSTDDSEQFEWSDAPFEFTHDSILATTELTNGYSENFKSPKNDEYPNRSGFLVQLGKFKVDGGVAPFFQKVVFYHQGAEVGELEYTEFTWIDIVGDSEIGSHPPIRAQSLEPFKLWPGGAGLCDAAGVASPCLELFGQVNGMLFPACDNCDQPGVLIQESCLQSRKIHAYLESVTNFVTIWQGDAGINQRLEPVGINTFGRMDSRLYFDLGGSYELNAYLADSECKMKPVKIPPKYDRVVFMGDTDPGTGGGVRQDPPWP